MEGGLKSLNFIKSLRRLTIFVIFFDFINFTCYKKISYVKNYWPTQNKSLSKS